MSREQEIDRDPTVRKVAGALGLGRERGLRRAIAEAAVARVEGWMSSLQIEPETLDDVHALVLNQTRIHVERVTTDQDLEELAARYRREHPVLPVQLELELGGDTEALVFQRRPERRGSPQYLAVVDARGERRLRAWFAERHEPGHVLIPDPTARVLWRRTRAERPEPIEQVVDAVASAVGFWAALVEPPLAACLRERPRALDAFEAARQQLAPEASQEASYRAFARHFPEPLFILWSEYGCRAEDRAPGGDPDRSWALRATTRIWNPAAERAGLRIWPNFRIPPDSVIAQAREAPADAVFVELDNLKRWRCETGRRLPDLPVRVTARGGWASLEVGG